MRLLNLPTEQRRSQELVKWRIDVCAIVLTSFDDRGQKETESLE